VVKITSFLFTSQLQNLAVKMNDYGSRRIPFFFVVDFLAKNCQIVPLDELDQEAIQIDFSGTSQENELIHLDKRLIPFDEYERHFNEVKKEILYGNSYLCNLTTQTEVDTQYSLEAIYQSALAKYKILYKNEWLCFSPETFVKIDYRGISSNPMKGTIDANLVNAEQILLNDPKEIAEHYTIVDLIRNDLSMVAKNVTVQKFRYLSKIETARGKLLQTSSKIVGELPKDYHKILGHIICQLLPAGSISGAPKKKTVEIISKTEGYDRGFYTGVAGVYDGEKVDSCVLIRFLEKTKSGLVYKSGGGITKYSEARKEYEEIKQKIYVPTS
jgi:para-aminobenzoate synthetase component 1